MNNIISTQTNTIIYLNELSTSFHNQNCQDLLKFKKIINVDR